MGNDIDRRTFLKTLGATSGAALLPGCTDAPLQRLYAYLVPPHEVTPGIPTWVASTCRDCPAGCGLLVKLREARPIKLEGNPASPINRGALCPRGQSTLQALYDPDRLATPLVGERPGEHSAVGAELALAVLAPRLARAAAEGRAGTRRLALVTRLQSGTPAALAATWARELGGRSLSFELLDQSALRHAARLLFGVDEVPRFDLGPADLLLSFGAEFLAAWQSPVEHARQIAEAHGFAAGRLAPFVAVGPRRGLTAAAADEWIDVRSGTEGLVALGLAHAVLASGAGRLDLEQRALAVALVRPYPLEQVAAQAGVSAGVLQRLAARCAAARTPAVLPPGHGSSGGGAATFDQAAALLLGHVLGATGRTAVFGEGNVWSALDPPAALLELLEEARQGRVAALVLAGVDPVYELPGREAVEEALQHVPLVIQLAEGPDETSPFAHALLPAAHFLQSWGDFVPRDGWHGLLQPVFPAPAGVRQSEDWLIGLAAAAGRPLPWPDFRTALGEAWAGLQQRFAPETDPAAFFHEAQRQGGFAPPEALLEPGRTVAGRGRELRLQAGASLPATPPLPGGTPEEPVLLVYPSIKLYDGRTANRPWIQELPDSLVQSLWDTPLEISPGLAGERGLHTGDRVELRRPDGRTLVATLRVLPNLRDDVVAMPLGGGRAAGRVARGHGARVLDLLDPAVEPESGALPLLQTGVALRRLGAGTFVTVEGNPFTHGRPILLTTALDDALAGRWSGAGHDGGTAGGDQGSFAQVERTPGERPQVSMYPQHDYPAHMWGMTVDLDLCNGCGACVVACYAENNIGVVGPQRIREGREMAWLQIQRYWQPDGGERGPRPHFIPLLCQHCENAPCESVCPVFAAYHTRDGLNAQIYNRCIGTRYCSNNCPYKVRRFNWFPWRWPPPLDLQLNPDVTVRHVGVMEKCTFCIQRIRAVTNRAKDEGRPVRDGEITPACAQTCPTGALRFGDRRQPGSLVNRIAAHPRSYRLLGPYLDTRPAIAYLQKVVRGGREVREVLSGRSGRHERSGRSGP